MHTRHPGRLALAVLGLALAAPVQAAPGFLDGAIIVASQDHGDKRAPDPRKHDRESSKRADDDGAYGYGYERRQQKRDERDGDRNDDRQRDRR